MSLFGLLGAGATGLHAQGLGMSVASQNAQNAGTDGYTRRDIRLYPIEPPPPGGGGVRARGSRRIMDRFVERRLLGASSAKAEAKSRSGALSVLDRVLSEETGGVASALDAFQAALTDLTGRPGDRGTRQAALSSAERLTTAFRTSAQAIEQARQDIDDQLGDEVGAVNQMVRGIADLGARIQEAEVAGEEASDLRDQRDQLVRDLSEKLPITTFEDPSGGFGVLLGGSLALVSPDGQASELAATRDAVTHEMKLTRITAGQSQDVTALADSGTIGGLVAARDGALKDAADALDQLAFDLATAYNAVHAAGYGSDGTSGRNLFETPTGVAGAAASLELSADVVGQPDLLAAATDPALTAGDNRNAMALAALADSKIARGGSMTMQASLAAMIGDAGHAMQGAEMDSEFADSARMQLESLRQSVSGVSVDEEMIALNRYQRGYEASLRVVQAADDMLRELMNMGR